MVGGPEGRLPHCGQCDPDTRQVGLADGRVGRCPRCHPLQDALLPQTWRCPRCHALIYRDQRGLPCDKHRTVTGWHREHDEAQAGHQDQLIPDEGAEAGAKAARAQLAARPRPDAPAGNPEAGLWGEALARVQVAEARARRDAELAPAPATPDGDFEPPY